MLAVTKGVLKLIDKLAWDGRTPPVTAESTGIVPRRPVSSYKEELRIREGNEQGAAVVAPSSHARAQS
jgi:hypothetical protein